MRIARVGLLALFVMACPGPGGTPTDGGSAGGGSAGGSATGGGSAGGSATGGGLGGGSGGGSAGGSGGGMTVDAGPTTYGFTLTTPAVAIDAGVVDKWCWFFRTPNAAAEHVRAFRSKHDGAIRYVSVWFTPTEVMAPGTVVNGCDQFGTYPGWAYSSWQPDAGWEFPQDDGTGKPLGKPLPANQPGYVYVQAVNATAATLSGGARIDVELYAPDAGVTEADSLMTYNNMISISTGSMASASKTCPPPAGAQFTRMTMYTHGYATLAEATGTQAMLFMSNDWENPIASTWSAPSFPTTTMLESRCTYVNNSGRTLTAGGSLEANEECVILSYFFPSSRPRICFNDTLIP